MSLLETMRLLREHPSPFKYESEPISGSNLRWGGVPAIGKWYLCGACEGGEFHHRVAIGAKFCAECGAKIDWPDPNSVKEGER